MNDPTCWSLWHAAAADPTLDRALRDLYADLDAAVAARGPTCWISGRCCKFESFDHRLYVTGLEIAWFLHQLETAPDLQGQIRQMTGDDHAPVLRLPALGDGEGACPYQINGLCSTHTVRPLGCRIFFCQHGTEAWQQDLYEQYLARLRQLHDRHDLPYRYIEWRTGLADAIHARPAGLDYQ